MDEFKQVIANGKTWHSYWGPETPADKRSSRRYARRQLHQQIIVTRRQYAGYVHELVSYLAGHDLN